MSNIVKIFIDGACQPNPGNGGIGIYLITDKDKVEISRALDGTVTNNIAEYRALIESLKLIIEKNISDGEIQIFSDSKLVCMHFNKVWKCKDKKLIPLLREALELSEKIELPLTITLIPREENTVADRLAKDGILA